MKPRILLIILALLAQGNLSFAGQEGSGGTVVACFKNHSDYQKVLSATESNDSKEPEKRVDVLAGIDLSTMTAELLDLYLDPGLGEPENGFIEPAKETLEKDLFLARLELLKSRSGLGDYLQNLYTIKLARKHWKNSPGGVVSLKDTGEKVINLPENCLLLTIAYQERIEDLVVIKYDKRVYDKLSVVHQVGLQFHELLNYHAHFLRIKDTRAVREITAAILSKDFDHVDSAIDFSNLLWNLKYFEPIKGPSFRPSPWFSKVETIIHGQKITLRNGAVMDKYPFYKDVTLERNPNTGNIRQGILVNPAELQGMSFPAGTGVGFDDLDNVEYIYTASPVKIDGVLFTEFVHLSPEGKVKLGTLAEDAVFISSKTGERVTMKLGEQVYLNADGKLQ